MEVLYDDEYNRLAEELKNHLETLGQSLHGARTKYRYVREFLHQMELKGKTKITAITSTDVENHYKYLQTRPSKKDGNKLSLKTLHTHMKAISQLFTILVIKGKIKINPTSALKFPMPIKKTERTILTQTEIAELYKVAITYQEKSILSLAYGCGLRVSELVATNIEDIKLRQEIIIVPRGKGNKRRVVPMSTGVIKDLENYFFKERENLTNGRDYNKTYTNYRLSNENSFMLHSRGGRMRKDTYNKHLKILIERTRNQAIISKNITIHNLRHSIATHLLEQGVKIEQVREFLGHSQLETTEIYTRVGQNQLKNLVR